jgi:photosystem II stability/assembly factor-like uncharacterized protein
MSFKKLIFSFAVALGLVLKMLTFPGCDVRERGKWELVHNEAFAHAPSVELIAFDNRYEGWALRSVELSRVTDNGRTWVPVLTSENGQRTYGSFVFTRNRGFLVGSKNNNGIHGTLVLETSDRGNTWQEVPTNTRTDTDRHKAPVLYSIGFCGDTDGWAVGRDIIIHTSDGHTWQSQRSNIEPDEVGLYSVACADAQHAWAVGAGGLALRTRDGGSSWTRQDVGTNDALIKVKFIAKEGWMVGGSSGKSLLMRTVDSGETWKRQSLDAGALLFDIWFIRTQGWIAGEHGTIMHTNDGGQTWSPQRTPTNENLTSLFFISPSQGWAGGERGTLLHFSE